MGLQSFGDWFVCYWSTLKVWLAILTSAARGRGRGASGAGCRDTTPGLAELTLAPTLSWRVHRSCPCPQSPLALGWTEEN